MKRKIIIILMFAAIGQLAMAQEYNYLTVTTTAAEQSITLSTVRKITFDDAQALVTTDNETISFALSELQKMAFTATPSAIDRMPEQTENLHYQEGTLTVGKAGNLRIYNTSGALLKVAHVTGRGGRVSLATLPAGLYIVTTGDQTIKIKK